MKGRESAMDEQSPVIGIITVGYNRVDSISRLLNRLNDCDYPHGDVPLVISLDNCGKTDVLDFAEAYRWRHGKKTVIHQPQRLGLKRHILKCGSYIEAYGWDAAIVLEDDVYTAACFYEYARQAVIAYRDDDRIAGISLYALTQNQTVQYPFSPALSQYDAYFMQYAQSLGQVWMRRQWKAFVSWYSENSETFTECGGVPFNVCRWPETSWLKYHIRYCVENDKYFVYPYNSLTTNFGDVGSHTTRRNSFLQTALQQKAKAAYNFPRFGCCDVNYDAWCENTGLVFDGIDPSQVCIDIYGGKRNYQKRRYWLTSLPKPYRIVKSFGMELLPPEMNVLCNLPGDAIFLYDTAEADTPPEVPDRDVFMWGYYNRLMYPDPAIRKLADGINKEIRRERRKLLRNPKELFKKIASRLR